MGLIAGLYQRGIGHAYLAGWESTWLAAPQVKWLIDALFGPVASWAGITLPKTVEQVAQLQFQPDGSGGASAAPWIHVIALCLLVAVVLPRLLLAGLAWFKGQRLQHTAALPEDLSAYARNALGAGGQGLQTSINVIPYAYEPGAPATARLEPALQEMFGRGARARMGGGETEGAGLPQCRHRAGGDAGLCARAGCGAQFCQQPGRCTRRPQPWHHRPRSRHAVCSHPAQSR
jgi:hypothetical protein